MGNPYLASNTPTSNDGHASFIRANAVRPIDRERAKRLQVVSAFANNTVEERNHRRDVKVQTLSDHILLLSMQGFWNEEAAHQISNTQYWAWLTAAIIPVSCCSEQQGSRNPSVSMTSRRGASKLQPALRPNKVWLKASDVKNGKREKQHRKIRTAILLRHYCWANSVQRERHRCVPCRRKRKVMTKIEV